MIEEQLELPLDDWVKPIDWWTSLHKKSHEETQTLRDALEMRRHQKELEKLRRYTGK